MNFETERLDDHKLIVNKDYTELLKFNGIETARDLWDFEGEAVKKILKQRGTERVFLNTPNGSRIEAYIKRYSPEPKREILKKVFSLKFHTFDAFHEWRALRAFHRAGIPTMEPMAVASPFKGCSCNLTLGITGYVKAAELFKNFTPADRCRRLRLIDNIAQIAGSMHAHNYAHQDFYLVHMFVREQENDKVYLIDLQRLIIQRKLSWRWRVKDLAQLLFASKPHVSRTDILRFWKKYCSIAGKRFFSDKFIIHSVQGKAARIAARDARKAAAKTK
ncbi:lipopolysaccharide kinase InaA family protein [Lentisphaerota bacterium ZTH]|nr:hypothetical protein JYG24_04695 [Lentisphaerota bacterium]WET07196.1 lipopolysaccharide kinase InaA family protein [Lentisphaerota bacterium ZTH]